MTEGLEIIGRKSVIWSYASVFFSVGAGVILLPFILHFLQPETVAVWNIFQAIYALVLLLDFGFRPSFARNLSYIFSGVREFQTEGVMHASGHEIDYGLLKSTIISMKKFYRWLAIAVFVLLVAAGTPYILSLMEKYNGDRSDALCSWGVFCAINCFNLYTFYYDALLTGKGFVKRLQQITILGQCIYLASAIFLLWLGYGLISVVSAQSLFIIVKRILARNVFYSAEMKRKISTAPAGNPDAILRVMMPNAVKVGLTQFGGFIINKSSLFFGSTYLALKDVAAYGISVQVVDVLARCGAMLYITYSPVIARCRAKNDMEGLRKLYFQSIISLVLVYVAGGFSILMFGNPILNIIKSRTLLLPTAILLYVLIFSLLEQNHIIAAGFIQADNRIPFFIPSLVSGVCAVLMIWLFLDVMDFGIWGLVIAPGIVQLAYQNWKWPLMIWKELRGIK